MSPLEGLPFSAFLFNWKDNDDFKWVDKAEKIHQNPSQRSHKIHIFKCYSVTFLPRDRSGALGLILRSFSLKNEAKIF